MKGLIGFTCGKKLELLQSLRGLNTFIHWDLYFNQREFYRTARMIRDGDEKTYCDESELHLADGESVVFFKQYVKGIRNFSSQYGSDINMPDAAMFQPEFSGAYTAHSIGGNILDFDSFFDEQQSSLAFTTRTYGKWWDEAPSRLDDFMPQNNESTVSHDFIDIGFHQEVYPVRVSLFESCNPGSLIRIWASDSRNQWHQLWSGPVQLLPDKPRVFSPSLEVCSFKTKMLRLEMNVAQLDYYSKFDGVLLLGTSELIQPRVKTQKLSSLLQESRALRRNIDDALNLTPDLSSKQSFEEDLLGIKNILQVHYVLHESQSAKKLPERESLPGTSDSVDTCDIFDILPNEAWLNILKFLDLKSLCRCARVNKRLSVISRDASLYESLNLKPYWNHIDSEALNFLMPRCERLQRLDLSWCGNYGALTSKEMNDFFNARGSTLTHLRLNSCQFVDDSVIATISSICTSLKELCLHNCRNVTNDGLGNLKKLRTLERLELYRTKIETSSLCSILSNNAHMKHLNLGETRNSLDMDSVTIAVANSCPHLESIDCWCSETLTEIGVRALAKCTRLQEVDFGWCNELGAQMFEREVEDALEIFLRNCCGSLKKIFFTGLRYMQRSDIAALLLCEHIQQLDLGGTCWAHNSSVYSSLFSHCPQLRMLDMSTCETPEIIQEWRQRYLHVSIKHSIQISYDY